MNLLEDLLLDYSKKSISILDAEISITSYCALDLSISNDSLTTVAITDPKECKEYIDKVLTLNKAEVAYGGYLERRNLYADKSNFSKEHSVARNIHLGIDYWANAGTKVLVP
ncbi:hypothetical protein [Cellulophaga sp. E16_2]|uniref:hypothetical protein n=1 Tax=Cellulophaga sp. E16_2 TaxID=2789297 RepID=UPI0032119B1A